MIKNRKEKYKGKIPYLMISGILTIGIMVFVCFLLRHSGNTEAEDWIATEEEWVSVEQKEESQPEDGDKEPADIEKTEEVPEHTEEVDSCVQSIETTEEETIDAAVDDRDMINTQEEESSCVNEQEGSEHAEENSAERIVPEVIVETGNQTEAEDVSEAGSEESTGEAKESLEETAVPDEMPKEEVVLPPKPEEPQEETSSGLNEMVEPEQGETVAQSHEHSWIFESYYQVPTCSNGGLVNEVCTHCGETQTTAGSPTGEHQFIVETAGDCCSVEIVICSECNYREVREKNAVNHVDVEDGFCYGCGQKTG